SQVDPRVPFKPDAWQREVLDAIDQSMSLLVVAPTSAGKTFISYYAMEKILRGSDDGILVYIAPTKALVAQVAAEIYARFSKDLNGRNCWAIHSRDYRVHDPQNCQILVTVPEILAIMLLSPPLAKTWSHRLKYVILDEIHTIGQQEGGAVWEQILLLSPCPIIGLSATVGAPERFNEWLESVQKAGGFQHKFVHYPHRYSHLRKFFYNIHEEPKDGFQGLSTYKSTERMRFLHPMSLLSFGARSLPSDLALEAIDTLNLYHALRACTALEPSILAALDPVVFFSSGKLLQQKDVIRYEGALKHHITPLLSSLDSRDSEAPLSRVITQLQDDVLSRVPDHALNSQPDRDVYGHNLISLVADLHVQGDLPAIFFSLDRSDCEHMAQILHDFLQTHEDVWRENSPEWQRKMTEYDAYLQRAKERERKAAREAKAKRKCDEEDKHVETSEWQASFRPNDPLPDFSFAGQATSYTASELDEDIADLERRKPGPPEWALQCLRRGIAVHHSGMNKAYRSLVESLFRRGFIRVIFATSTLALGINAPTKTSVFCGDSPFLTALMYRQCAGRAGRRGYDLLGKVVFYGLPMSRVQRLVLSKLPSLSASFPVTSTLVVRLFNLLEGSDYSKIAVAAVQRLFRVPHISFGSEEGGYQLLHHLRFSIDYLRRAALLDEQGKPLNLFGIAAHLNLALVALLRSGVIHKICAQPSLKFAKRDFILLMAHLFGRRYLPSACVKEEYITKVVKNSPSMVILPPLSEAAREVLVDQDREILRIFTGYALTYGSQHDTDLGPDYVLPLSKIDVSGTAEDSPSPIREHLHSTAIRVIARSLFVANSGHDDNFDSIHDLARTARHGMNLNEHIIPSFDGITAQTHSGDGKYALNAYLLDFYTHGQVAALATANAIRRGDVWYLLEEFNLTLLTVRGVLEQLLQRRSASGKDTMVDEDDIEDVDNGYAAVGWDDGESSEKEEQEGRDATHHSQKPHDMSGMDWRVFEVVNGALEEFHEKFKAMWA
ncbi:P-loop containing nucleoside triphosphate hydrolase protein, partial [Rhizopogon vinicolor AM-OR11-026]